MLTALLLTEPLTYEPRTYRTRMARAGLVGFQVAVKETDLWVLAGRDLSPEVREVVLQERRQLEAYIGRHPEFRTTLTPWPEDPFAPPVVRQMIEAARTVGVGPMAAVAGALAERVGRALAPLSDEIIVENGGDLYLQVASPATVSLFAGKSPLSHRVGLKIDPALSPLGVCTSSGTVGPSSVSAEPTPPVSWPRARPWRTPRPAAWATGSSRPGILPRPWSGPREVPEVLGAVVIVGDKLGAWGRVELVPLAG